MIPLVPSTQPHRPASLLQSDSFDPEELLAHFTAALEEKQNPDQAAFSILETHPDLEISFVSENFTQHQRDVHRKALKNSSLRSSRLWIDQALEWMHWISLTHAGRFPSSSCCWTLLYEELLLHPDIEDEDQEAIQDLADRIAEASPDLLDYLRVSSIKDLKADGGFFILRTANNPDLKNNFLLLLSRVYLASLENTQVYQLAYELETNEEHSILHCRERSSALFWRKLLSIPDDEASSSWRAVTQSIHTLASETTSLDDKLQLQKDLQACNVISSELAALCRDLAHFSPDSLNYEQFCFLVKEAFDQDGVLPLFPLCKEALSHLECNHRILRKEFPANRLHRELLTRIKELRADLHFHFPPPVPTPLSEFFFYFDTPIYEASASLLFHLMAASDRSGWPLSWIQAWQITESQYSLDLQSQETLPLAAYQGFIHQIWEQIGPEEMDLSELLKRRIEELPSAEFQALLRKMNAEPSQSSRSPALIAYFSTKLGRPPDLSWLLENLL